MVFELQTNGEYKIVGRTELQPLAWNNIVHTGEGLMRKLLSMDQEVLTAIINKRYVSVYDEQYAEKTAFYRIVNSMLHTIENVKTINTQIPSEARNKKLARISGRVKLNYFYSLPDIFSMMCNYYDMETIFKGFLGEE